MQAHISSGVVMDIATFKVSHAVVVDIHATALQAQKKERITFHRGDGANVCGGSKMQALTSYDAKITSTRTQQSVSSRQVQWGDGTLHVGSIRRKTHVGLPRHTAKQ